MAILFILTIIFLEIIELVKLALTREHGSCSVRVMSFWFDLSIATVYV